MVSIQKFADRALIALHFIVLGAYLFNRKDYMEYFVILKMHQCSSVLEKIEQLEKWDQNYKYEVPPGISNEEWNTFWFMFRDTAYHRYRHIFLENYSPPNLRSSRITITEGGRSIGIINV